MIIISKEKWRSIHKDYKAGKKGKRRVFAGCIEKDGGTKVIYENVHFKIVWEH